MGAGVLGDREVTGACALPLWVLGIKLWSSVRAVPVLYHRAMSLVLGEFF